MVLLKIGELAKKAGITVRTLHHYDHIGLLRPTTVDESGHRWYNQKDVERLQQIVSLKSLGFKLTEITRCLSDKTYDLHQTLTLHETAVRAHIDDLKRVQTRLRLMIEKVKRNQALALSELLESMKEVQNMEKHYTPEQLKKLQNRFEQFPEQVNEVQKAWPELFKKFEEAMNANLPETDLKVQVLASEAQLYIDLFTGGDKEIEKNLEKSYAEQQENALKVWNVSPEVFQYAERARRNLKKLKQ